MCIRSLVNEKMARPERLPDNVHYLPLMGSLAFGVSTVSSAHGTLCSLKGLAALTRVSGRVRTN